MQEKEQSLRARNARLAQRVIKGLQSRNFEAHYCETAPEAAQKALSLMPPGASVSWGGSVTLVETGLLDLVRQGGFSVIDRDTAATPDERYELMRRALTCDVYLTSFNALSEDGVLVNVDSAGNRVAAITFGPRQVIAIIGMHKVCKTADDAVQRARTQAAPLNAARTAFSPFFAPVENTPCALQGSCGNCKADACICSTIATTRMCKPAGRIKVILVGEALGL